MLIAEIGEPSPWSSPLAPLSESPESESGSHPLSLQADQDQPLRGSVDSVSSGYDHLSRWAFSNLLTLLGAPGETDTFTPFQQILVIRERTWTWSIRAGPHTPAPTLAGFDASQPVDIITSARENITPLSVASLELFFTSSHRPRLDEPELWRFGGPPPISSGIITFIFLCTTIRGVVAQSAKHSEKIH